MADPNLVNFYARVARFEKLHAKGYAFEAPGTITHARRRNQRSVLGRMVKPLVLMAACAIGLKAAIYHQVGSEAYGARVAALQQGQGFDPLAGWLMQADGATVFFAGKIDQALAYLPQ